jgi:hypothetical protein
MRHLLPDRCPTCGQHWPQDAPGKPLRLILHWLPKLTIGVGLFVCLIGIGWFTSAAR